jgi:hypothetical protein
MTDNPFVDPIQPERRRLPLAQPVDWPGQRDFRCAKRPFPLVKVLLGAFALLFTFCGGGLGLILWSTGTFGPDWKRFEPSGVGASVEMPYRARQSAGPGDPGYWGVTVYEGIRLAPRQEFALSHATNGMSADGLLDSFQSMLRGDCPNLTETSRLTTKTPQGVRAVDVIWNLGNGETMHCRAVETGTNVYLVSALGSGFTAQTPEVRRFLDSLTITDPDKLAAAKAHGELQAKRDVEKAEAKAQHDRNAAEQQARAAREAAEWQARTAQEAAEREAAAEKNRRLMDAFDAIQYSGKALPDAAKGKDVRVYFSFDEGLPATASTGSTGTSAPGVRKNALRLTTPHAVLDAEPVGLSLAGSDAVTIAGWFKAAQPAGDVITVRAGPNDRMAELFAISLDSTAVRARFGDCSWPEIHRLTGDPQPLTAGWVPDMNWHHFALTCEPTDRGEVVSFYLDGKRAIRQYRSFRTKWSRARYVTLGINRNRVNWEGQTDKYLGSVDEVLFAARAYTASEVRALGAFPDTSPVASTVPTAKDVPGLVLCLPLDEITQNASIDTDSAKVVGSMGGIFSEVPGVRGQAIRFEHSGPAPVPGSRTTTGLDLKDKVEVLKIRENEPFTVATWCRTILPQGQGTAWSLVSPLRDPKLLSRRSPDQLGVFFSNGFVGGHCSTARPTPSKVLRHLHANFRHGGEWFHVAMTRDKAGTLRLAVNGEFVRQEDDPIFPLDLAPTELTIAPGGGVDLDEFCVFDRDLTADELKFLAGRGTAKPK